MAFRRFYSDVSVVLKLSLQQETDMPAHVNDEALITEDIYEQVNRELSETLPAEWLDDVVIDIVSIR